MKLDQLEFDNSFTASLPADPSAENRPRQVNEAAFSRVAPVPTAAPSLVAASPEMLTLLGLDADEAAGAESSRFAAVFTGNETLPGMDPHAMAYAGHQFGNFAGQLGDGRAITLGEVITPANGRQTLQLKGAGPTPYSRTADGLAVLRSSIREFLCSEAMHHLGVPTTRALSLSLTGDEVMRDMFYDGRAALEPGAVVCRVAPSFIRFGNFELFSWRQDHENLRRLTDYTIRTHFPELGEPSPDVYAEWFAEISRRTVDMVIHWQRVGFVHGVMNTDNMSIHGLTIDYGPYGWLEDYDPGWTPNTTDNQFKRYRYGAQPAICQWNLTQLANALHPLIGATEPLQAGLELFVDRFNTDWPVMMAAKLGLDDFDPGGNDASSDKELIESLTGILPAVETDMTLFFRALADVPANTDDEHQLIAPLADAYYSPDELTGDVRAATVEWLRHYSVRVGRHGRSDRDRREAMNSVNPKYVLRNYLAQLAIDASEQGDHQLVTDLLDVLRNPYDEQPGAQRFAEKRPEWARTRAGCSMLSCSS